MTSTVSSEQGSDSKRQRTDDVLLSSDLQSVGLPASTGNIVDIEDIWTLHRATCEAGKDFYIDPASGYQVFSRLAHERRGRCCGSGCRHCPFDYENVVDGKLAQRIQQPTFLYMSAAERDTPHVVVAQHADESSVVVLCWSTGKDSFLTLRALRRMAVDVVLLTTFDARSRIIANQEVDVSDAVRQATHLDVSLVGVPLHAGVDYVERIQAGLDVVRRRRPVRALAFGDLHLEHIRAWRDDRLRPEVTGVQELLYPLWKVPYEELHDDLTASGVPCHVSALGPGGNSAVVSIGDCFDRDFAQRATAAGMDSFGERGEFHTLAKVWESKTPLLVTMAT